MTAQDRASLRAPLIAASFRGASLAYLALALLLGGASAGGFAANLAVQVVGAGLAGWAIARGALVQPTALRWPLRIGGVLVLAQFIPLPPSLWSQLPGRAAVLQGFVMLGQVPPWLPLGLAPWHALAALAAGIPPLAVWLALRLPGAPQRQATQVVVLIAVLSVPLGLMQQFGGVGYIYLITITDWGRDCSPMPITRAIFCS